MKLPPKPTLNEFIPTCTPLAKIPTLEEEFRQRVTGIAQALLNFSPSENPLKALADFLRADRDFLGIILALTNLSQEKFLRILSAERFANADFGSEWSIDAIHRKIANDPDFASRIAQLFLEGSSNPTLATQVAAFYLDQLALPTDWQNLIRDPNIVQNAIRRKLMGEYTDRKGDAIEAIIRSYLDDIYATYGVTHTKGQVALVGKEVDHAVPSTTDPHVLIMTSYMETTSSSQTQRANEHRSMFLEVQGDNIRYGRQRAFVNFVDGAGWLARRTDLRKMVDGCHYIINLKTLHLLGAIVCKHVPAQYFTRQAKPLVEE